MTRAIIAIVAGAATVGSLAVAEAAAHHPSFPSVVRASLSNLVLYAFGTHPVPPGNIRVPIATADATYEVIVKKPGPAALEHLDARIDSPRGCCEIH
jgi:hypothetical protein